MSRDYQKRIAKALAKSLRNSILTRQVIPENQWVGKLAARLERALKAAAEDEVPAEELNYFREFLLPACLEAGIEELEKP